MSVNAVLSRKTLGGGGMWAFGVAASAPMVVLSGGIIATYATTGVIGVPLAFLLIGAVVAVLAVGYTAMARRVPHAAVHYALLGRGLGRVAGVSGGMVALLAYNAIQISLYGLLGATMAGLAGGAWWLWAYLALVVVAVLGVRAVALSTRLLAAVLVLSLLVVVMFDAAALGAPADGTLSLRGFDPDALFVSGVGGAVALCLAAFMGVEAPASFSEEARSGRSVSRSVFGGVAVLTVLYAVTAWAVGVAVGPASVAAAAGDPGVGLPYNVLLDAYGPLLPAFARAVLIAAILTSLLAFHSVAARYGFAIAREGVLPAALATTGRGRRAGNPVGGSLLQTGVAAAVLTAFAALGADPVAALFTWLSTLGALGLLALLILASVTAVAHLSRHADTESLWTRLVAPVLGVAAGTAVLLALLFNVDSLLGAPQGSPLPFVIPGTVVAVALAGALWALRLRRADPEVYRGISRGRPRPHAVPDRRLDHIDV